MDSGEVLKKVFEACWVFTENMTDEMIAGEALWRAVESLIWKIIAAKAIQLRVPGSALRNA